MKNPDVHEIIINTHRKISNLRWKMSKNEWIKMTWKTSNSHENQHIHKENTIKTQKWSDLKRKNNNE